MANRHSIDKQKLQQPRKELHMIFGKTRLQFDVEIFQVSAHHIDVTL